MVRVKMTYLKTCGRHNLKGGYIFNSNSKRGLHIICGQAIVEMAIFGILILLCLAVLIQYGQFFNAQQASQMSAFRQALVLAHHYSHRANEMGQVSFTDSQDVRVVSPFGSYDGSQNTQIQSGALVLWDPNYYDHYGREDRKKPKQFIRVNQETYEIVIPDEYAPEENQEAVLEVVEEAIPGSSLVGPYQMDPNQIGTSINTSVNTTSTRHEDAEYEYVGLTEEIGIDETIRTNFRIKYINLETGEEVSQTEPLDSIEQRNPLPAVLIRRWKAPQPRDDWKWSFR
jgi:hypothetical protein